MKVLHFNTTAERLAFLRGGYTELKPIVAKEEPKEVAEEKPKKKSRKKKKAEEE